MNKKADDTTATVTDTAELENSRKANSRKSVYIYIATLFLIVLLFILLSYFIQQRNNSALHTLNEKNATAQQNIVNLQTMNLQLQSENEAYKEQITELEAQISGLEEKVEDTKALWQNDVQNVIKNDAAKYNELLTAYNELIKKYEVKGNSK